MPANIIAKTQVALQVEEATTQLTDESDLIISDLTQQLARLKQQVLQYEAEKRERPKTNSGASADQESETSEVKLALEIKKHQVSAMLGEALPQIAQRVQNPIRQVSETLEELIPTINDPDVQRSLEQCQRLARTALQSVQSLQAKSQLLKTPLSAQPKVIDIISFFKTIAQQKNKEGGQARLFASPNLPKALYIDEDLFRKALLILLKEVGHLSEGDMVKITLKRGNQTLYDLNLPHLQVGLLGEKAWSLPAETPLSHIMNQALARSTEVGLDMLYAQKILEEQGGTLGLRHDQDQVVGFEITLPTHER